VEDFNYTISHSSVTSCSSSAPYSETASICVLLLIWENKFHTNTILQVKLKLC